MQSQAAPSEAACTYTPKHLGIKPVERANPDFPVLGGELAAAFSTTGEAISGIRYIQREMTRLEGSVATVFGTDSGYQYNLDIVREMLKHLQRAVKIDNLPEIHRILRDVIGPLDPWTTTVLRNLEQQVSFIYIVYVSLLHLTTSIMTLGLAVNPADDFCPATWLKLAQNAIVMMDRLEILVDGPPRLRAAGEKSQLPVASPSNSRSKGLWRIFRTKLSGRTSD